MHAAVALQPIAMIPVLNALRGVPANSTAATPPRAPRPLAEPEEVTLLRASQIDHVATAEIELFFTGDADNDNDDARNTARAVIGGWIAKLEPRDQDALALYYEPEPWPESILEEGLDYTAGYALVLSRAASDWRPKGRRSYAVEHSNSQQLRAAVLVHGPRALRHLTRQAEWDFAAALRAYAKARGRAPSVLAGLRRAVSAMEAS